MKVCVWDKGETIKSTHKSFEEKQKDVAEKELKNISHKPLRQKFSQLEKHHNADILNNDSVHIILKNINKAVHLLWLLKNL